jgi:hypothetical protein
MMIFDGFTRGIYHPEGCFSENKPNFPHFSPENEDFAKKQTQFKPKQSQNKPNFGPKSPVANPIQTQNKAES